MTTQDYINANKTKTIKQGDKVVMRNCAEAEIHEGRIWECRTDSYIAKGGDECVFLTGFSGCFLVKCLKHYNDISKETNEE